MAREILANSPFSALGTLAPDGGPFTSLTGFATLPAGEPILLLSALAVHTRNLDRDPRASLLFVAAGSLSGDPLAGARLSLNGRVKPLGDDAAARRRFLARNPEAEAYAGFGDFSFRLLETETAHLVAGFGRIDQLAPGELHPSFAGAAEVVTAEDDILAQLNEVHGETIGLVASALLGQSGGAWRATGSDPDGLDLAASGGRRARLWYPSRAATPEEVWSTLKNLAEMARRR